MESEDGDVQKTTDTRSFAEQAMDISRGTGRVLSLSTPHKLVVDWQIKTKLKS